MASDGVAGNPECLRNEELRQRAWEIVEPEVDPAKTRARARLHELAAIVLAAGEGRVDE